MLNGNAATGDRCLSLTEASLRSPFSVPDLRPAFDFHIQPCSPGEL
jgi:hypothetical protein